VSIAVNRTMRRLMRYDRRVRLGRINLASERNFPLLPALFFPWLAGSIRAAACITAYFIVFVLSGSAQQIYPSETGGIETQGQDAVPKAPSGVSDQPALIARPLLPRVRVWWCLHPSKDQVPLGTTTSSGSITPAKAAPPSPRIQLPHSSRTPHSAH
jgi:hypothetical protein